MEFSEKLQELRKRKEITQEELADAIFVSRAAVSKWESGRGYPNIDSLKAIAKFFSVTVDELISSEQALTIAEEEQNRKQKSFCDLWFGLLDICFGMLIFLPLFAVRGDGSARAVSLLELGEILTFLKVVDFAAVICTAIWGILILAMQNVRFEIWSKVKYKISIALGAVAVAGFTLGLHPYAAVFAFVLLVIKAFMLIKIK